MRSVPCVFMRGGTSKALMFHARDLPPDDEARDALFLLALGSPDPYGRQLEGMGGGVSSLSKVCVMGPPSRPDADVDYTFVQVSVEEARVNRRGNCGNMSAAVGPFCVDEGLVTRLDGPATVRIRNTNTGKIILSHFEVRGGRLLPTGRPTDRFTIEGWGPVDVSVVDAANLIPFVRAQDIGLTGIELPQDMEATTIAMHVLREIGRHAQVATGIAPDLDTARDMALPLIAWVASPRESFDLSGTRIAADDAELCVRMLSDGQPHRALPMTGSICTSIAARIGGTVMNQCTARPREFTRLAMPSGVIHVDAEFSGSSQSLHAVRGSVYRTARRLFEGRVCY